MSRALGLDCPLVSTDRVPSRVSWSQLPPPRKRDQLGLHLSQGNLRKRTRQTVDLDYFLAALSESFRDFLRRSDKPRQASAKKNIPEANQPSVILSFEPNSSFPPYQISMTPNADPKRNTMASRKEAIRNGSLAPAFMSRGFSTNVSDRDALLSSSKRYDEK